MTTPETPIPVRRGILRFAASVLQLVVDDVDMPDLISRASNARAMIVESCPPDMFDGGAELIEAAANSPDAPAVTLPDTVRYLVKGENTEMDLRTSFVPARHDVIHLPDGRRARRTGEPDVHWTADRVVEIRVEVDFEGDF